MTMHAKRSYHALSQGIRTTKTFTEYKFLPQINVQQSTAGSVKYCDHWSKIKTISQINHSMST